MAEQYNSAYTGPEIDTAIAKARSTPNHAFTPDTAAQFADYLLYIASDGKITPLKLGKGLEIVNGVLNVVGGGNAAKAICGEATCGSVVCGAV